MVVVQRAAADTMLIIVRDDHVLVGMSWQVGDIRRH